LRQRRRGRRQIQGGAVRLEGDKLATRFRPFAAAELDGKVAAASARKTFRRLDWY